MAQETHSFEMQSLAPSEAASFPAPTLQKGFDRSNLRIKPPAILAGFFFLFPFPFELTASDLYLASETQSRFHPCSLAHYSEVAPELPSSEGMGEAWPVPSSALAHYLGLL